jgi:hypothetical protein
VRRDSFTATQWRRLPKSPASAAAPRLDPQSGGEQFLVGGAGAPQVVHQAGPARRGVADGEPGVIAQVGAQPLPQIASATTAT